MNDLYHLELFKLPDELNLQELFVKILVRISKDLLTGKDQSDNSEGYFCSALPVVPAVAVVAVVVVAVEIAGAWHIFGAWGYIIAVAIYSKLYAFGS